MRSRSKLSVAAAVTVATVVVCFFGARAELNRARQIEAANLHSAKPLEAPPRLVRD